MTFPEQPHHVFKRNPLEEVICQLKFPSLLKIDAEQPVAFQEAIRAKYPLYEEVAVNGGIAVPPELARFLGPAGGGPPQLERKFLTEDRSWSLTLSREFLALSSQKYVRWSDFREHLEGPLAAFETAYAPAFLARIGLRYRNVIRRSALNLADAGWADLLKPHIACELTDADAQQDIVNTAHVVGFRLPQFGAVANLRHGLGQTTGAEGEERGYIIDIDLFTVERTELTNVLEVLSFLNGQAHRLFGWCISDRLSAALQPELVTA